MNYEKGKQTAQYVQYATAAQDFKSNRPLKHFSIIILPVLGVGITHAYTVNCNIFMNNILHNAKPGYF